MAAQHSDDTTSSMLPPPTPATPLLPPPPPPPSSSPPVRDSDDTHTNLNSGQHPPPPSSSRIVIPHVLAALLLFFTGVAVSTTVRVQLVLDANNNDISRAALFNGFMLALQALLSCVLTPLCGAVSDIVGRKPVFLLAHMGECFALVFLAYFPMSLPLIGVALMLMSSTDVYSTIVSAIIADTASNSGGNGSGRRRGSTMIVVNNEGQQQQQQQQQNEPLNNNMHAEEEEEQQRGSTVTAPAAAETAARFAYVGGALGFCFIFGPIVGSFLETQLFPRASLHVGYGFVIAAFLYAILILPETLQRSSPSYPSSSSSPSFSTPTPPTITSKIFALLHVFRTTPLNPLPRAHSLLSQSPLLRNLALAYGLLSFTTSGLSGIFYIYVSIRLNWAVSDYGIFLATIGIVSLVSQLFLVRIFVSMLGERGAVLFGMCCLALSGLIQTVAWNSTCMYVALAVSTPGFVIDPAIKGAVARSRPPGEQGNLQGSLAAVGYVVKIISPLASTAMLSMGVQIGWIGMPMMMFVVVKLFVLRLLWGASITPGGVGGKKKNEKEKVTVS